MIFDLGTDTILRLSVSSLMLFLSTPPFSPLHAVKRGLSAMPRTSYISKVIDEEAVTMLVFVVHIIHQASIYMQPLII
jgi:hypothetical protein